MGHLPQAVLLFFWTFQDEIADINVEAHHITFAVLMIPSYMLIVALSNDAMDRLYFRDGYRFLEVLVCETWQGDEDEGGGEADAGAVAAGGDHTAHQLLHIDCPKLSSPSSNIFYGQFRKTNSSCTSEWKTLRQVREVDCSVPTFSCNRE